MRVLLTGATGFLGSHLARALLKRNDKVVAYHRSSSSLQRLADLATRIRWVNLDAEELGFPFTDGGPIDAIIHAATCYGRAGESTAAILDANTRFPLAVFEHGRQHGVRVYLNIHTALPRSLNAYSLSKHHLVDWLQFLGSSTKALHLAIEHFYGPGDDGSKFVEWILRQMLAGVDRIPLTKGEQRRDFLFIDDTVAACLACLDQADQLSHNQIVPVGSGVPVAIRDLVEACRTAVGAETILDFGAVPYRVGEVMESVADLSSLGKLNWRPLVPLQDGLNAVVRHLRGGPETLGIPK